MSQETSTHESLRNFYPRQAHLIDTKQHETWAHTFMADGEFHSPTYGAPAVGYDELINISRRFAEGAAQTRTQQRHIVQNVWIVRCDDQSATVQVYLSVTASDESGVRILRTVTLEDELVHTSGQWLIHKRQVVY